MSLSQHYLPVSAARWEIKKSFLLGHQKLEQFLLIEDQYYSLYTFPKLSQSGVNNEDAKSLLHYQNSAPKLSVSYNNNVGRVCESWVREKIAWNAWRCSYRCEFFIVHFSQYHKDLCSTFSATPPPQWFTLRMCIIEQKTFTVLTSFYWKTIAWLCRNNSSARTLPGCR